MVREADAAALVVHAAVALKLDGHDPVITAENSVWLMRHAALMIGAFGIGTTTTESRETDHV